MGADETFTRFGEAIRDDEDTTMAPTIEARVCEKSDDRVSPIWPVAFHRLSLGRMCDVSDGHTRLGGRDRPAIR